MEAKNYILDLIADTYLLASGSEDPVFSRWKYIWKQRKKRGVEILICKRPLKPLSARGHMAGGTSPVSERQLWSVQFTLILIQSCQETRFLSHQIFKSVLIQLCTFWCNLIAVRLQAACDRDDTLFTFYLPKGTQPPCGFSGLWVPWAQVFLRFHPQCLEQGVVWSSCSRTIYWIIKMSWFHQASPSGSLILSSDEAWSKL